MTTENIMTEAATKDWTDSDWNKFRDWLNGMLKVSAGTVTFTKKDGTERVMQCTLVPGELPPVVIKEGVEVKPRKESETALRVYDTEVKDWRSFAIRSIKNVRFEI